MEPSRIRRIEEHALTAWPAPGQVLEDGWVLRFAGGFTRRANSVNCLYGSRREAEAKIAAAAALYRAQGLPPVFRLTPLADPPDLDERLAAAGYRAVEPSLVLLAPDLAGIARTARPPGCGLAIEAVPSEDWLDAGAWLRPLGDRGRVLQRRIVEAIVPPAGFASLREGERTVAIVLGVVHDGMLALQQAATAPDRRGRGLMRHLLGELSEWAQGQGATAAHLAVGAANAPALGLYRRLGFGEAYRYHYRIAAAS